MPTIWINGVKHTPTSRTLKKMKAAGQKWSTSPPTGTSASKATVRTASKGVGAKGVSSTSVKRAGTQTPASSPPIPRPRGDRPKEEKKAAATPLKNEGRPVGFSTTKYTGPFEKGSKRPSGIGMASTPQLTAQDKFRLTPAKARLRAMQEKADETAKKKRYNRNGRVTGGGF